MANRNGFYTQCSILALVILAHIGIAFVSLSAVAAVLFLDGFVLFLIGYIILPRKPGWSGWKRTLGFWNFSLTCLLFAAAALYAGDGIASIIIVVAVISMLCGVGLLASRTFPPPHAHRGA